MYIDRDRYVFADSEITPMVAKFHLHNRFSGRRGTPRDDVITEIINNHERFLGKPSSTPDKLGAAISNGFINLPNKLVMGGSKKTIWTLETLHIGTGDKCVYCWYYIEDQIQAYKKDKIHWRCNIGKTDNDTNPIERIKQQLNKNQGDYAVPLIAYTTDNLALENDIHNVLKQHKRQLTDAGKKDDFKTCPTEVANLICSSSYMDIPKSGRINFYPQSWKLRF